MQLSKPTVGKWRSRFVARRLDGLLDEPRPGAPRQISDAAVERVLSLTLEKRPADATHWSTRSSLRAQPERGQPHLACLRSAATSCRNLSAFQGSAVH